MQSEHTDNPEAAKIIYRAVRHGVMMQHKDDIQAPQTLKLYFCRDRRGRRQPKIVYMGGSLAALFL